MRHALTVTNGRTEIEAPSWMTPKGWFVIAWSHEVAAEAVVPVKAFGQDLIVYRTRDGGVHALAAHCWHLGAHLGYGGRVVDDCVVCPFHGWSWGADGSNVAVPEGKVSKRRLQTWPVTEMNGIIYVWHNVTGGEPEWSMPDIFEDLRDEYPTPEFWPADASTCFRYGNQPIEPRVTVENLVDPAHFRYVHGTRDLPTLLDYEVTDSYFRTKLLVHSRGKRPDSAPMRQDTVTLKNWGVGISHTRFSGRDNTHAILSVTPVNEHESTLRQTIFVEKLDGETDEQRQQRVAAIESVYPEDIVIWRHQRFVNPPSLQTDEAKLFRLLRKWARSFEPEPGRYEPVEPRADL